MTIDTSDLLNSILGSLSRIDYIKPEEVPNIPLYMDQVTTFMDAQLASSKRYPEDKILTKTMINNYAKNDLLPPPLKKKYSKEHLLVLVFIYYFKSILSITDIQVLLKPITDTYFSSSENLSLEDIYNEVFRLEKSQVDILKEDITNRYRLSRETFQDAPEKDQEFLKKLKLVISMDGKKLYSGDLLAVSLNKAVSLGIFQPGKSGEMEFQITVPSELNNDFALRNGDVKWIFSVEEDQKEKIQPSQTPAGQSEKEENSDGYFRKTGASSGKTAPVKTGDDTGIRFFLILEEVALLAGILVLRKGGRKN